jgi:hypothetical protein
MSNAWRVFDESSRETIPRNSVPVEFEYNNGETVQGTYKDGQFSVDPHIKNNNLPVRTAQPVRFRYLDLS